MFIKQVPDTTDVKWTENNNIDRANMESIMNPADRGALEAALKLKDLYNAEITAITMGPEKSKEILKEAIAMGADEAVLLCDSKFAGSDTCATSKILETCIKEKFNNTDIFFFGQSAIDGETGQTGHSTAKRLNIPSVGNVSEIIEVNDQEITLISETEEERRTYKIKMPCAICINNYITKPRIPKINGYIKSQKYNYITYNLYDINIQEDKTGVKGSPTYVCKIYRNTDKREGKIVYNTEEIYQEIKKVI